ncbi:hypothetical protein EMIT0P253_440024 [Pseudomonas sp. IT-P253]
MEVRSLLNLTNTLQVNVTGSVFCISLLWDLLQVASEELLQPFTLRIAQYVPGRPLLFHAPLMQKQHLV